MAARLYHESGYFLAFDGEGLRNPERAPFGVPNDSELEPCGGMALRGRAREPGSSCKWKLGAVDVSGGAPPSARLQRISLAFRYRHRLHPRSSAAGFIANSAGRMDNRFTVNQEAPRRPFKIFMNERLRSSSRMHPVASAWSSVDIVAYAIRSGLV